VLYIIQYWYVRTDISSEKKHRKKQRLQYHQQDVKGFSTTLVLGVYIIHVEHPTEDRPSFDLYK